LNLLRVPLDVLPISENSPADPFASRQPTKNFVRLSGKSSKKILQGSNRFDRVLGIWELDSCMAPGLFMVIFAGTISLVIRINIKKQAGIGC
jgi:hypothetical protein